VFEIENETQVPEKFRFPMFKKMMWYAASRYHEVLQGMQSADLLVLGSVINSSFQNVEQH
jgi:hypothetical protein